MKHKIVLTVVTCLGMMAFADDSYRPNNLWSRSEQMTTEGKKQYEIITEKLPRYGECWKNAVDKLHAGCSYLTEDMQSRLALAFADCFLKKAGRKGIPCSEDTPVEDCLRDMQDSAFDAYTEFFTHTQSICFYLQSQSWHQKTDDTIHRLSRSSEKVSHQIQQAGDIQGEILKLQEKSVSAQNLLLENGANLNHELERSRRGVREAFDEFRASTGEQRLLITEAFDRVVSLQALVLGEFNGFYSYLYYSLAVLVVYLLTSTPRTRTARFWLLGVWTVNIIFERAILPYFIQDYQGTFDNNSSVYHYAWLCRKISCIIAASLLAWFSIRYKDYNVLNNRLLTEIHRQNEDLKTLLQSSGQGIKTIQVNGNPFCTSLGTPPHKDRRSYYDDSDDSTYDSTFVYSSSSEEDDNESWVSLGSRDGSRSVTPVPQLLNVATFSPLKYLTTRNETCETPRYNLRARVKEQSPNPLVQKESSKTFEKVVKKLARNSRRNGQNVKKLLAGQTKYSSDEQ